MKRNASSITNKLQSGFVRSVITRVLMIFIAFSIIIACVTFYLFTSEIRHATLDDRQKQLVSFEQTISGRMSEMTSVAYNIGKDPVFYTVPVESDLKTGSEMAEMLERYLVGNSYIEHLAYSRVSEPNIIYTSKGTRDLSDFFVYTMGMTREVAASLVSEINSANSVHIELFGSGENACFTYSYPIPELASVPQAHVLMIIPMKSVTPLIDKMLVNFNGDVSVFDAEGKKIFKTDKINDEIDLSEFVKGNQKEITYKSKSGQKYVLQKTVSTTNSWTYVSTMKYSDTLTGIANKQIGFIVIVLALVTAATVIMLVIVIVQYKPIKNLAEQIAEKNQDGSSPKIIDERTLLSDRLSSLKDDSEQKQKFQTAYYEAEAASKAKSAFLSNMSHDIRTPMNAIIGMTAIARNHIGDQAYVDECLKKVQISSDYLLDIINNVLDMSRIESGRIPITAEPMHIPSLIDSVVSLMTSSAEAKSQSLSTDVALTNASVLGDNIHIVQVFVNIISNAVKFTPEGGTINITVRQSENERTDYGTYEFTFTDTGVGIPPDFIDKVFDTFSRADDGEIPKTEGTGLGMAIAKKLVELMGGNIRCESELNVGTTFIVTLPMKFAEEDLTESMSKELAKPHTNRGGVKHTVVDLSGKRILLAEDNSMNREIARLIIAETKAEVVDASNGREAVELFADNPVGYFDLIFMDIQMPIMTGYDATAEIRSMERPDAATIPIYAMTANTFDEDIRRVKAAGMNGHIGKPYNPATLYKVLSEVLCQ